jgi:uridine kinase
MRTATPGKGFIVGLGGPSGSGKSTVAKRVASRLNGNVISMETYSAGSDDAPFEERAKRNYDEPDVIDVELLERHIRQYAAGQAFEAPIYDFAQHLRVTNRTEHVSAREILIVEGILALHFPQLQPFFDLAIYLEAPADVLFHRRRVRDITERQRSIDLIRWQYETMVIPAARRYLPTSKARADLVVDSKDDLANVEKEVYEAILKKRSAATAG